MDLIKTLVSRMQQRVKNDPTYSPELFTDWRYVYGDQRCCHDLAVKLVKDAATDLPGVIPSQSEKQLGKSPRWRPDVVLSNQSGQPIGVIEYESLNSSDSRVVDKDMYGYEGWHKTLTTPVPLLVITTLPDSPSPEYRLQYKSFGLYNADHAAHEAQMQKSPLAYWYGFYRLWLEPLITNQALPVHFANFTGNKLTLFISWPVPALPYVPAMDDGSDWSKKWGAPPQVQELRKAYKKRLWGMTDVAAMRKTLKEFWDKEQEAYGSKGWDTPNEVAFLRAVERVQNAADACRVIEKLQWSMY